MSETSNLGTLGQSALANTLRFATNPLDMKAFLQLQPGNMAALHSVIAVLGDGRTTSIAFDMANLAVNSQTFAAVRHAIAFGQIQVFNMLLGDPDAAISDGIYEPTGNYLKIALNTAQPLVRKAKIVHECVHASHDIDKRAKMFRRDSELAAYIAEATFIRNCYPKAQSRPNELRPINFVAPGAAEEASAKQAEAIAAAAWDCAVRVTASATTFAANDPLLMALEKAITSSDLYRHNHGDHIIADGVL